MLWVAGAGPETGRLRSRYPDSDRLTWLGRISDEEVARRLVGAEVLCAPSLSGESFGMVLLEAMAARAAVIASDLPGYRAAAGGHARLIPPGDVGGFRDALEEQLREVSELRGANGPEALEKALVHAESMSMARLAEAYEAVYESAIEHRKSSR
jgi:phosphatidylinositol alpha-mannosyltransferase